MTDLVIALGAIGKQFAALNPEANAAHFQAIEDHLAKDDADNAETRAGLQAFIDEAKGTNVTGAGDGTAGTAAGSTPAGGA